YRGIDDVLGVSFRRRAFFGSKRVKVIPCGIRDRVGAGVEDSTLNEPLALAPVARAFLGLPIITDLDVVGIGQVVGQTERDGVVSAAAAVITRNPCSAPGAAVVAEAKSLGDFDEIGGASLRQSRARRACFQGRLSG